VAAEADAMMFPALAPDGHRIARAVTVGGNRDVFIHDTRRGTRTRLTFEATSDEFPTWDPTGTRIAYHLFTNSTDASSFKVMERAADGTGQVDTLMRRAVFPTYRPDGRALSYVTFDEGVTRWDLTERPLPGPGEARLLVTGNPRVMEGRVSPRGDVMAYMSQETRSWEIFLTRYPSCEGKWQVSTGGGQWPRWDAKGDRLFFVQGDDVMEVTVGGGGAPVLGTPQRLFTRPAVGPWNFGLNAGFEVSSDGERVLVARAADRGETPLGVTVVQDWAAEFATPAPAARR
jgi:Tol biopolymer transport system component